MHPHRTAARQSPRVRGLGLTDVLSVELEPCQVGGMIEELDERQGPLHEAFDVARRRWDALSEAERDRPHGRELEESMSDAAYLLEVSRKLRSQLPAPADQTGGTLVGPASLVSSLIRGGARNGVAELAEVLQDPCGADEQTQRRLLAVAKCVVAWIDTYVECEALIWFRLDDGEPVHDVAWPQGES